MAQSVNYMKIIVNLPVEVSENILNFIVKRKVLFIIFGWQGEIKACVK